LCVFSIVLKHAHLILLPVGHWSENEKYAKSINVIVPPLFHLQRIVKKTGDVAKEKNESERGKRRTGESGDIDVHKHLRMMRTVSVVMIAGGSAAGHQVENVAKLSRERKAHAASNRMMRMNGWKNLLRLAPLSPLFPVLSRP
jgi:hypothetical protein